MNSIKASETLCCLASIYPEGYKSSGGSSPATFCWRLPALSAQTQPLNPQLLQLEDYQSCLLPVTQPMIQLKEPATPPSLLFLSERLADQIT